MPREPIPGVQEYPFQTEGIDRIIPILRKGGGAILADEMGLGKTPQAAIIAEAVRGPTGTVLVVCPAAVRHQWVAWLSKVHSTSTPCDLGPPSKKQYAGQWARWEHGGPYGVVSYNLFRDALELRRPRLIIFDEFHNYMQGRGNTYVKVMWRYGAQIQYKLALSGSPYLSKPAGLYSMLNILYGGEFRKARDFDVRYCNGHQGKWGWLNNGATNIHELSSKLSRFMVRREKRDPKIKAQLPPVSRTIRWVEADPQATSALAGMDYSVTGMRKALEPTLAKKIPEVFHLVEETDAPCVVFTWRRTDAEQIAVALDTAHIDSIYVHGEFDADARAQMIAQATKKRQTVVTTYGASATGLDGLQHLSAHAIFHAIDPVPPMLMQAIARLDRIGQESPVLATFVAMKDSVDELTIDKVVNRLDIYGQILGRDQSTVGLRDAMLKGGLGDVNSDKVLQALFDEMTGD